jgi:hypothetical protein
LYVTESVLYGCETWSLTLREKCRLRIYKNRVLRRIFGPQRDEVTREWRRLLNKELYALYSSPDIIRVIKLRRLRWSGDVARTGRGARQRVLMEKLRKGSHLEDPGVDGRIIIKWIFERFDGGAWTGSIWLRTGTGGGLLWM